MAEQPAADTTIEDRRKAAYADYYARGQSVYSAYLDVTTGGVERAQTRATFVATAAGVIGTAYAGLLGFLYKSATETITLPLAAAPAGTPVPGGPPPTPVAAPPAVQTAVAGLPDYVTQVVGSGDKGASLTVLLNHRPGLPAVLPEFFIALAVLLATTYLSWLVRGRPLVPRPSVGLLTMQNNNDRADFIDWVAQPIYARVWLLHGAVASLAWGVLMLPVPFMQWSPVVAVLLLVVGIGVVFALMDNGPGGKPPMRRPREPVPAVPTPVAPPPGQPAPGNP